MLRLHTAGVTGSIPVAPTIHLKIDSFDRRLRGASHPAGRRDLFQSIRRSLIATEASYPRKTGVCSGAKGTKWG